MTEKETIKCKVAVTFCYVMCAVVLLFRGDIVSIMPISLEIVHVWLF